MYRLSFVKTRVKYQFNNNFSSGVVWCSCGRANIGNRVYWSCGYLMKSLVICQFGVPATFTKSPPFDRVHHDHRVLVTCLQWYSYRFAMLDHDKFIVKRKMKTVLTVFYSIFTFSNRSTKSTRWTRHFIKLYTSKNDSNIISLYTNISLKITGYKRR